MKAAVKLQKQASKVGFDWSDPLLVLDKISEEIEEVREELTRNEGINEEAIKSEIGDLLFAVANLARHASVEPDEALAHTNQKFRKRFGHIETELAKQNIPLATPVCKRWKYYGRKPKENDGQSRHSILNLLRSSCWILSGALTLRSMPVSVSARSSTSQWR